MRIATANPEWWTVANPEDWSFIKFAFWPKTWWYLFRLKRKERASLAFNYDPRRDGYQYGYEQGEC